MEPIKFRCPACQQELTFPASRAGKGGKCTRCGKELSIPTTSSPPPPPPPPPADDEDDEGGKHYDIVVNPEEENKKRLPPSKKKKKDKGKAAIKKKRKALTDADQWMVVRHGLLLMSIGAWSWGGIFLLRVIVMLIGCVSGAEYNPVRLQVLVRDNNLPGPGDMGNVDLIGFWIGLVSGTELVSFSVAMNIVIAFLTIVQTAFFMMGYFTCMVVPDRLGMRGQVLAMILLGSFNLLAMILFRLLPLLGVFSYTMNYYLVPELPMLDVNIERLTPVHVFWAGSPIGEMILTMVLLGCLYTEYNLGAVFLRNVSIVIREELLTDSTMGLLELGLGTLFALLSYYLASLCGTSDVMISVCRLIYLLWAFFIGLYIVRYAVLLNRTRLVLNKRLQGLEDSEAEDEAAEEKKNKKSARDEDDDDADDEDDEDEDRPPRKKKKKR